MPLEGLERVADGAETPAALTHQCHLWNVGNTAETGELIGLVTD